MAGRNDDHAKRLARIAELREIVARLSHKHGVAGGTVWHEELARLEAVKPSKSVKAEVIIEEEVDDGASG